MQGIDIRYIPDDPLGNYQRAALIWAAMVIMKKELEECYTVALQMMDRASKEISLSAAKHALTQEPSFEGSRVSPS